MNPYIENRALAMVFNPTDHMVTTTLRLPLYYAGLDTKVAVYERGDLMGVHGVDRDYSVVVPITLNAKGITSFLIKQSS